ncbi:MAG: hypothetical protein LBQ09_02200, partial [Acidobacteriaceae bacterium]|nr:hypothetical protein [Acidobacteriaceae bacterium]
AANGNRDAGAQAQAALDKLKQVQQQLQQNQTGRGDRDLQSVRNQAQQLADEQKQIAAEVDSLSSQPIATRQEKAQNLTQRKDAMDQKVGDLQTQLEKLANDARRDTRDAARKLDEAAGSITDKRIREKIQYTRNNVRGASSDYSRSIEQQLQSDLDSLTKKIDEAQAAMGQADKQDAANRANERARNLVRGMESLDQRMRDRAQQNAQGQNAQGQRGQQDQNGQQQGGQQGQQNGQQGSQSAQGQQAQNGQQGGQQSGQQSGQQGGQQAGQQSGQQGGQQGGQQAGGNARGGGDRNGTYAGGAINNGNYGYGRWTGRFNPDDVRQFRNDVRQWANDAQALRNELARQGFDTKDLDQAVSDIRRLDSDQAFVDPSSVAALQGAALDKLKKFEFDLRKKSEGNNENLSLSGSDEVPAGFRTSIEEYYRSLAKK